MKTCHFISIVKLANRDQRTLRNTCTVKCYVSTNLYCVRIR